MRTSFRALLTLTCVLFLTAWSIGCNRPDPAGVPAEAGNGASAGPSADGRESDPTVDPQTAESETAASDDADDFLFEFDSGDAGTALGSGGFGFDDE